MPHTINGFIVLMALLCGLYWLAAHAYDRYQENQVRRAFRRDKR